MRKGQAIMRLSSTSSTVIGSRNMARGFIAAHSRCTTGTIAIFSIGTL